MWLTLVTGIAFALSDEEIVDAVSKIYGKPVPADAVCIARPTLPEGYTASTAVGVQRGAAGCRLLGVVVGEQWYDVTPAGAAALVPEVWTRSKAQGRKDLLEAWTRDVLLAFDYVADDAKATVTATASGGWSVSLPFVQRTDDKLVVRETAGTFSFDKNGTFESMDRDRGPRFRSQLYVREQRVDGVSVEQVMAALEQQGGRLHKCFEAAWKQDPYVQGRIRLRWTIRDGAATQLTIVDEGEPIFEPLAACYGGAIQRVPFDKALAGQVEWNFSVVRSEVTD